MQKPITEASSKPKTFCSVMLQTGRRYVQATNLMKDTHLPSQQATQLATDRAKTMRRRYRWQIGTGGDVQLH